MVNERISTVKIVFLIILVACLFIMGILSAKYVYYESEAEKKMFSYSIWFSILGLISLVVTVGDTVMQETDKRGKKKQRELFETIVYEKSWFMKLPTWSKVTSYIVIFIWGLVVFFQAKGGFETIEAPEYAVVGLGPIGNGIISMTAGFIENYAWFGVAPSLFGYTLFYSVFGGKKAGKIAEVMGIVGFLFIGTGMWIGYHWFRYGLSNLSATIDVAEFAFFNLIWVYTTKNIILPMVWHGFNNLGYHLYNVPVNWLSVLLPLLGFIIFIVGFRYVLWSMNPKKKKRRGGVFPRFLRISNAW